MLNKKLQRRHSYSSLSLFLQCKYKYYLKYICGFYPQGSSPYFDIGNLAHLVMENVGNGADIEEQIGYYKKEFKKIPPKFPDFDFEPYIEKNKIFFKRLKKGICGDDYEIVGTELEFRVKLFGETIMGKIDLLLRNKATGSLKVVDYKTNKKVFSKKDRNNSLQQAIYGLACQQMYGVTPIEYEYDMLFLGKKQSALDDQVDIIKYVSDEIYKIFEQMNKNFELDEYEPNKTVLCSYCSYGKLESYSPDIFYGGICDYALLWRRGEGFIEKGKQFKSKHTPKEEDWGDWDY